MSKPRSKQGRMILAVILLLLFSLRVSLGDGEAEIIVYNNTDYYIHVLADGQSYMYIRPFTGVELIVEHEQVSVQVFIAPGQDRSGSAIREFTVNLYADQGCSGGGCSTGYSNQPRWDVQLSDLR